MSMQGKTREHLIDEFGYRTRQVLNTGAEQVDDRMADRLSAARALALTRQKSESAPLPLSVGNGILAGASWWDGVRMPRLAFALAALVLAVGVLGMNEWREQAQIDELADIDSAILADEVPFTAHLDPNYKTLLTRAQ